MRDNRIVRVEDRIVLPNVLRLNVRRADDWDKIVATRTSHNIVVNDGRNWIRGLLGASSFQNAPTVAIPGPAWTGVYPGQDTSAWTVDDALLPPFNNYRLRYMSLGGGGMFAVGGTYAEAVTINGLETPVPITDPLAPPAIYMKECLPSPNHLDLDVFPTAYDFAARCVWGSEDISYDPLASVDVSEIAIFTSRADPDADSADLTEPTGVPGIAAWNCFTPVAKSQDVVFEAIWLWRL